VPPAVACSGALFPDDGKREKNRCSMHERNTTNISLDSKVAGVQHGQYCGALQLMIAVAMMGGGIEKKRWR
jgi:hypothetical protein